MKIFILQIVLVTLIISGCSSDSNRSSANPCGNIADFTVTQQNQNIVFNLVATETPLFYEVSVINAVNGLDPNSGLFHIINTVNQSFTINDLGMVVGNTYIFYIRSACSDGTKSDWSTAKSLVLNSFCATPYDIAINDHSLVWSYDTTEFSQYQVEYGIQGFTQGTGTLASVNATVYPYVAMQENLTYDFYVRANCNGSLGWSDWVGPYTYLCPVHYNDCNMPSNLGYSIQRNFFNQATGANVSWDFNGEANFEYTMVYAGQPVTAGIINYGGQSSSVYFSLTQNTNYHLYVRAACRNGNKTNWAGPMLINIGF